MALKRHFSVSLRKAKLCRAAKKGSAVRGVKNFAHALKRKWNTLSVPPHELCLDITLTNGQCFGWKRYPPAPASAPRKGKKGLKRKSTGKGATEVPMFYGIIGSDVLLLRQTPTDTQYQVLNSTTDRHGNGLLEAQEMKRINSVLRDYFQLGTNLKDLYLRWQKSGDKRFLQISAALPGMRILRQDPVECLFSFMCSSNNNISRIVMIMDRLRERYGDLLWKDSELGIECYSFPSIERLASATEQELRGLGLGYRAPWIHETAMALHQIANDSSGHASGLDYLLSLRGLEQQAVQDALVHYKGVGRKVADCIALFSLDQTACVPVDTHVWRIACRDFDPTLRTAKSLTASVYARVGDLFHRAFGSHAGWAHSVLFAAELPAFTSRLPVHIRANMLTFRMQEKALKAKKKLSSKQKRSTNQKTGNSRKRVRKT